MLKHTPTCMDPTQKGSTLALTTGIRKKTTFFFLFCCSVCPLHDITPPKTMSSCLTNQELRTRVCPFFFNENGACRCPKGRSVTSSSSTSFCQEKFGIRCWWNSRGAGEKQKPHYRLNRGGNSQPEPQFPFSFSSTYVQLKKKLYICFVLSIRQLFTVATTIFHTLKTYSNFIFLILRRQPFKHSTKKVKKVKRNVVTKPVNKI